MQGYSDDILHLKMGTHEDEVDCYDREVHVEMRAKGGMAGSYTAAAAPSGGIRLVWRYGQRDALWSVEVELLAENVGVPWPVLISGGDKPYSVRASIDVSPDTVEVAVTKHKVAASC
jgi:hypothetical protein